MRPAGARLVTRVARYTQYFAIAVCALSASPLHAQHHAHVHGVAELQLLQDGETLIIELRSPAVNILGFEHPVEHADYLQAAEQARSKLSDSDSLFRLKGGACQLATVSIDITGSSKNSAHQRHNDVVASYAYQCKRAETLRSLSTSIQRVFPSIHSLNAQWVLNHRQGAANINHNQQHIVFK